MTTTENIKIIFQTKEQLEGHLDSLKRLQAVATTMGNTKDESPLWDYVAAKVIEYTAELQPLIQAMHNVANGFPEFNETKESYRDGQ